METLTALPLVTHSLIGFYFAFFGFWNTYHWRPLMETLSQRNIAHPWLLLPIGIVWQTLAGFMIMLNFYLNIAAISLIPFTLIAIFLLYPFWQFHGEQRGLHFTLFITHLLVTVSALILIA